MPVLAGLGCSVSARDITAELQRRGGRAGSASVYRTLDLLERRDLAGRVPRLPAGA